MTAVDDAVMTRGRTITPTRDRVQKRSPKAPTVVPAAATRTQTLHAAAVAPRASEALVTRNQSEKRYRKRLAMTDGVIVLLACMLATIVTMLITMPDVLLGDPWILVRVPLSTAIVWMAALALLNTRDPLVMGSGATEYTRVTHATGLAFGLLAIVYVIFEWQGIRTQLFLALPAGLMALIVSRWLMRRWLLHQRTRGRYMSRTVVVGTHDDVEYAVKTLRASGYLGYQVVGTAVLGNEQGPNRMAFDGHVYPVVRGEDAAYRAATGLKADTLLLASQLTDDPGYIKRLTWQLEGTAAELVLSSRIADVAGPRMSLRPVEGMPLIHVQIPTFQGGAYVIKRALDIVVSALALIAFAPFALIIAMLIKIDNRGPVFFLQSRVGRDGRLFKMVKFRSMRVDAEEQLARLKAANEGAGPLFKMKDDPRITRVGKYLRKFSLDEVPQFWNVLRGDMSVVGPRPPLPDEVTAYDGTVFRRLYINPGITGPWQVGGRSDLSWDESVRLDLRYVENWSVMNDLQIMWRTAKVMVSSSGAY